MYLLGRKCVVGDELSDEPLGREDGFPILSIDLLFAKWGSARVLRDHILRIVKGPRRNDEIELSQEELAQIHQDITTHAIRARPGREHDWGYVVLEDLSGLREWLKQPERGIQKKIILWLSY